MAEGGLKESSRELENIFRYASSEYSVSFFKTIHQLRLDSIFCDVQLHIENKVFSCHKVILMAGSPYFHAMFISGMTEHNKDTVNIGGVSPQIFASLLQFLYTGEVEVTEDTCEDLLTAADMFSIAEVISACCTFLIDRLQPGNCIGIYLFAEAISCNILLKAAERYIHKHFVKMVQEEEFYALDKAPLIHFLYSENLHVEHEYQVFKAAMDWILHNVAARKKHVFDVMATIRFPIIPDKQIDKYIATLADIDISIQVVLQKILNDMRNEKKTLNVLDKKFKKANISGKHFLTVPRQCARKNIYICGGFTRAVGGRWSDAQTLNTVERYDTFYRIWHDCPSLQYQRSALGAGVVNGQVCVMGGENDMLILDSTETYDPVTYEWSSLPGMTTPRCGLGVCTIDNCLYAIGGWVGSEMGSTVEKYDPETQEWTTIAHCRKLKCWMGVTSDKGLMYIVGGSNDLSEELMSVESFNPVTKEWTTLADMSTRRSYVGVAVLGDCLYAVGGWNEQDGALKSVEKLPFGKGHWVEVSPMSVGRAAASVVVVNNMLYVMGGRNYQDELIAPSTLDSMETYDPTTDTWTEAESMITSRCEGAAVVI